ncbi:hypothetical protein EV702DRAFT_44589 [Suillus placidus]|uniref:Uncharacterized protein n=1 Tax=Suillus placidus TaxID=48579 RepID=A0A9P7A866_9AGAM|nr:hypothetical protein EV702DRAFT_44589 [Suillus placidus]
MTFRKGIPIDSAAIMSTVLEGILYGFSVLMFIGTIWALTYKRHMRDVNRPITSVAVLLFVLSTAHMVVDIIQTEDGLVKYHDTFTSGPEAFFVDVPRKIFVIKNAIFILQTLLGDGVVIYRCFVVWQTIWVIILPSMLWCSVAVTGFYSVYNFLQAVQPTSNTERIFSKTTLRCIAAFYTLTLVTNLLSSGLLAFRIWKIERSVSTAHATKVTTTGILRVIMDAATLYSISLLCALISSLCSNDGGFVMIGILTSIISITFYMVIIRIAMGKNTHSHTLTVRGGSTGQGSLQHYPLKPLQVHISQFTHTDSASVYRGGDLDRASTGGRASVEGATCDV